MEQYIREHLRAHFKMKKTISIIQILILIIGILAFSYMVGEIGKKSGIEISRGVGIVSAQENNPDACASNMAPYCFQEQAVTCENNFLKYTSPKGFKILSARTPCIITPRSSGNFFNWTI